MYYTIAKNIIIILTTHFLFTKLCTITISKVQNFFTLSLIIPLSITVSLLRNYTEIPYTPVIIALYIILTTVSIHLHLPTSTNLAILTYTISYIIFTLTSSLVLFIAVLIMHKNSFYFMVPLMILTGTITFTVSIYLFNIKRIRKGLQLISYGNFANWGLLSSITILCIITIAQTLNITSEKYSLYLTPIFLLILSTLYWFQNQTKKYYLTKLRALELESLHRELAEKDAQIQKLMDSNDALARIIHRDNKIIPAMEAAVRDYLENLNLDFTNTDSSDKALTTEMLSELHEHGMALSKQLSAMTQDRKGILTAYENQRSELPRSGHVGIDAVLSYMKDRAATLHIAYTVKIGEDFSSAISSPVTEEDLVHLLSDLIENALIATQSSDKRAVFVHLGTLSGALSIEVSDSGAPFEPSVYQDFGIRKHSTHLDNGGSGIGLMDIWELKKKYSASLHIYEYAPDTEPYTKKLSLVFDSKNHYLIRSYRAQEIVMLQARSDMYVLPLELSRNL